MLLDTHAFVFWATGPRRLPAKARAAIDSAAEAGGQLVVSSISIWEISTLVATERMVICIDVATWIRKAEAIPSIEFVAVDNHIAARAAALQGFKSGDLADRIIVATALTLGATVVTGDPNFHTYTGIRCLWT